MNAQTPASAFDDPEHLRQRALEARRMADLISDIPSKEAMLGIAEDYERLAKQAEERAKRTIKHKRKLGQKLAGVRLG